jgi:endonuclease/exonuclease/phosphatase family metal-dependent hydrolase
LRRAIHLVASAALGIALVSPLAGAGRSAAAPTTPGTAPAALSATSIRVATFNVRTARATQDARTWLERVPDVAKEILARNPGIVMLQELGPGRADGQTGSLNGTPRQTESLVTTLGRLGGSRYRLVRTTAYVKPGTEYGTQGTRILYDTTRYQLLSRCPDTTDGSSWNPACAFDLPVAAGDTADDRRSAAFAKFTDPHTGLQFWVASAHLDPRHSSNDTTEAKYDQLRATQAAAVVNRVAAHNTTGLPVIFGGDINSWQTDRGGYAPHRALVARSYVDAVSAPTKINYAYPTVNHFKTTLSPSGSRYGGPRLDVVMVRGGGTFTRYENKMEVTDSTRPSDHNMVVADHRF